MFQTFANDFQRNFIADNRCLFKEEHIRVFCHLRFELFDKLFAVGGVQNIEAVDKRLRFGAGSFFFDLRLAHQNILD